ncbi:MAG: carboxypeptidase-like regulatory domain-containing protein, partial [Clostridiaceae bacterium]|nr:carboxypeptidase-like regulatory domain-containing protein [Clostridiaceae bacterium]
MRRISEILVVFYLAISFIPPPVVKAEANINIGDYVLMGKYYDELILWRCVDIDENGPLMLSDKIIAFKPFDATGYHTYADGTPQADTEFWLEDGYYNYRFNGRVHYGSNLWETSNIRCWLNSAATAGNVTWLDNCPPTAQALYDYNVIGAGQDGWWFVNWWTWEECLKSEYASEKGFLADGNFTAEERSLIKSVQQKSLLNEIDAPKLAIGGTAAHIYDTNISTVLQNYDTAYYHDVVDTMFLLDVKQLSKVYQNSAILGIDYWKKNYATLSALEHSIIIDPDPTLKHAYLLRTPHCEFNIVSFGEYKYYPISYYRTLRDYEYVEYIEYMDARAILHNEIRPAFYLDQSVASIESGIGSEQQPYILTDKASVLSVNVVDAGTGENISGACVSINTDNKVTDETGMVEFELNDFDVYTLTANKEGYTDYEGPVDVKTEEHTETIYLKKGIAINSVMVTLPDGGTRDLLTDSGFTVDNEDEQDYTLTAKVDWNNEQGKKGTVTLVGAKSKKRVTFDSSGKLTKKLGKEFEKGEKVYVEAVAEDTGESDKEMLHAEMEEIADKLRQGAQNYKIPYIQGPVVDNDIPIIGGTSFNFDLDKLSEAVNVSIKDRKVIIKIGKGNTLKEYKSLPKIIATRSKSIKYLGLMGGAKADLEIFGKFEIPIDILKEESEFSGSVGLALGASGKGSADGFATIAEIQNQLAIGPVPVVVKLKFGAGFEAEGGVSATKWNFSDAKPSFSIT